VNETPSQTIGPFFRIGLSPLALPELGLDAPGALTLVGRVYDGAEAVPDAMVEFSGAGRFVRVLSESDGSFVATVHKPVSETTSHAPSLDVSVFARGLLQRLVTRLYFPDEEEANARDAVLASVPATRRATLVAHAESDGQLRFDVYLQGQRETVFFEY